MAAGGIAGLAVTGDRAINAGTALGQVGLEEGFAAEAGRAEMGLVEISREMLEGWIARGNPGARFFNNRRATWKTFLNRCRTWGWWPGGLPTPAEEIERRREPVLLQWVQRQRPGRLLLRAPQECSLRAPGSEPLRRAGRRRRRTRARPH